MKKSRLLSMALCVVLVLSSLSLTAFALSFDDVENDPTVSWAKESIHKMTDAGYIKGYEDGTFRPFRPITKIECLILMSRMLGYENDEFAAAKDAAAEMYGEVAEKYNTTYAGEISYLLYCGVLKESELVDYASVANANTQLLRYQAAMLMAKLMGADEEAKEYSVDSATYADDMVIPTAAKPYVEYVTAVGIMNGMDATADGEPQFSPVTSLTRAQMAALLARLMDKLDVEYISGTVDSVDETEIVVDDEQIAVADATMAYYEGEEADIEDFGKGDEVLVVKACERAFAVATIETNAEETIVYGVVDTKGENADGQRVTVYDYEDEDNSATYTLKGNCDIYVDDTKATFSNIMSGDFVKLTIVNSLVSEISTVDTKFDVIGKIVTVDYDNNDNVYMEIADNKDGSVQRYTVSSKGVVVSRDGEDAEFRDLTVGDSVTVRLTYGKITRVTAVSTTERFSGLLTEIILSSNPSVTISVNGVENTYKLRSDVKITVAGSTGDIYDLRPNITVSGKLDGSMIKELTAATVSVNEEGEMVGTVVGKNTTYNVLMIEDEDGNTQNVYYKSSTKFMNRSGQNTTVKSIEEGASVSIVGAAKNGVFEATIIILK